ncbi:MAG: regulatory protein UhpC [Candidatus Methanofastidiosum methylothiophilum]|uniref:Lysosomal dipeptide transporter MFSD1 n=1 Tax=Candidatus Methanofastidiosum methylothiophilum TaxID=1705564 RepID=A0A150II54_9EURY|nr:MAG: regulatory protein UhpC [Candidatus Methanofastidiosum methylthiophilus]
MANKTKLNFKTYRFLVFLIIGIAYLLVFFHRVAPAVVALDMMSDLKAGAVLIGFLASGYFYPYAIMQLPTGILSDSWGPRKTITLFFLIASIGSFILGLSVDISSAIFGRILVGLGASTLYVCALKILSQWYKGEEFATMTGFLIAIGGVGLLVSTIPLALLSNAVGWRIPFIITGGITLLIALLVWVFVRNSPQEIGMPAVIRNKSSEDGGMPLLGMPAVVKNNTSTQKKSPILRSSVKVLSLKYYWPASIWMFCTMAIYLAFGGLWGGPYLVQVYSMTKVEASKVLSMIAVGMIIGSPLMGVLSDRIIKRRKIVVNVSSVILLLIMLFLYFWVSSIPSIGLYLLCLGIGIFSVGTVAIGYALIKDLFPVEIAGTSTGIANFFPFLIGALYQPLMGYILELNGKVGDSYTVLGYQNAFLVLLISSLIACIASFFIKETKSGTLE